MSFPYDVVDYDIDIICTHISRFTDTPFHHIREKKQINYLHHYLTSDDGLHAKTIIIEHNYIERHYLEDYSEYYVRCFNDYSSSCSRIHFFSDMQGVSLNNHSFNKLLQTNNSKIKKSISLSYLGYVVIRPIPYNFLGKVCLKPYNYLPNLIAPEQDISLFGINLKINSVPFQEQDRVVAACATTSLWTFFHASNIQLPQNIPSPSRITKLARPLHDGYDRQFPNAGLSGSMIFNSIRSNNLEPEIIKFSDSNDWLMQLREIVYAYTKSNIPIIFGVTVYAKNKDGEEEVKGLHAITILGYSCSDTIQITNNHGIKLKSDHVYKLYAHDDRLGPYARLELPVNLIVPHQINISVDSVINTDKTFEVEYFKPHELIIGVYHKIRIKYQSIKNTCDQLNNWLGEMYDLYNKDLPQLEKKHEWVWDIVLVNNSEFKSSLFNSKIALNKTKLLTSPWPKYIWIASVEHNNEKLFDLLFDATDIPQGKVFLEAVYYTETINLLFDVFSIYCKRVFVNTKLDDGNNTATLHHMWGIYKSYYKQHACFTDSLDTSYGHARLPLYVRDNEIIKGDLEDKSDALVFYEPNNKFTLKSQSKYIWLINEDGALIVGTEDKAINPGGHVTLNQGRPSRIAGEINFINNKWRVNSSSGRHSGNYLVNDKKRYLRNAIRLRLKIYLAKYSFSIEKNY